MRKDKGFTLIELLVVVAIIGILAAIAIPQFSAYRQRGFDSQAVSDLRNIATGEEAYFVDHQRYVTVTCAVDGTTCTPALPGVPGKARQSSVSITAVAAASGTPASFSGTGSAPNNGTGRVFTWNSLNGGLQ